MIAADQPSMFSPDLLVAVSARNDGTVLDKAIGIHDGSIVSNRTRFCEAAGISYGDVVFQRIIYRSGATYDLLAEVDDRSTTTYTAEVVADALFTKVPGVGLFLPIADCIATVVFDANRKFLALLHLGRHSTLTGLVDKTVQHFVTQGSDPSDLVVWMSPSVQKNSYKMQYFEHAAEEGWRDYVQETPDGYYLDMQGYNKMKFLAAGIPLENMYISAVDTATDENYFSHSRGDSKGRFAVVAAIR